MAGSTPERPAQQWPSPWPYDFPVAGKAVTSDDKVARLALKDGGPPLTVTRRGLFLSAVAGWGAFIGAGHVGLLGVVRFLFPNVSFEPPQVFKTGPREIFGPETVDETWKESNAVWMVNTGGRLIAVSTVCTHLGCTPNWMPGERKFKCPCHGSGYYINGVNFEGPTPRPLERFALYVDPVDGRVVVDKTVKCQVEQATCDADKFFLAVG
jgi:cytochrome b6-f complex iron-sulfur subunit